MHAIASRNPETAQSLAGSVGAQAMAGQQAVTQCDLIFLTVPDDAIEETARALTWRAGHAVLHCSGATEVSALASAAADGAQIGGFHPLQSFADTGTDLAGCTITVEAAPPLLDSLETMVAALGCRLNRLPPGKRALYHASAGYGSQFVHVLLAEITDLWGDWDASEDDVLAAILPMMRASLDSIERDGIAQAMPGPVSRGDAGSVAAHLDALGTRPDALDFYRAHCRRSVALARRAGRINAEKADSLHALLSKRRG